MAEFSETVRPDQPGDRDDFDGKVSGSFGARRASTFNNQLCVCSRAFSCTPTRDRLVCSASGENKTSAPDQSARDGFCLIPREIADLLDRCCASFEASLREAPQDEDFS
jgi:hypothetical protein